jgi:hypothetical protein
MNLRMMLMVFAFAVPCASIQSADSNSIPDRLKPIGAATRIFQEENHLGGEDIEVFDENEGHIGDHLEINPIQGTNCAFSMRERDGDVLETIDFSKLSTEYSTSFQDAYLLINIKGKPNAVCDFQGGKKCLDGLEMLLLPDEWSLASRALNYIFGNVCRPAQLPF